MCILGAAPFAVLGFVTYNGMNAEQFIVAYIKSQILMPKVLKYRGYNYYHNLYNPILESVRKKGLKESEVFRQNK